MPRLVVALMRRIGACGSQTASTAERSLRVRTAGRAYWHRHCYRAMAEVVMHALGLISAAALQKRMAAT